jgi:hypothetical protein
MSDALGRGPLGFPSVVVAFSVGTGYSRALRKRARQATLCRELWKEATFCGSYRDTDAVKVSRELMERLTDALCYAA